MTKKKTDKDRMRNLAVKMITNIQVQLKQSDYKRWMQKNS